MTEDEKLAAVEELMGEIAKSLVTHPQAVLVEAVEPDEGDDPDATILEMRVAPEDIGKVIGKQGRTARSMRTLLQAVALKHHTRYTLDIIEDSEIEDDEETTLHSHEPDQL